MDKLPSNKSDRAKRVYLRVPTKLAGKIYLEGQFYRNVYVNDLSSTGLSFYLDESVNLPDFFELHLQLRPFSKIIKIQMEVRNRISVSGGLRIGCRFLKISGKGQNRINNYVSRVANFSGSSTIVNIAALLCSIDAVWRILAYLINFYYQGTGFGKSLQLPPVKDLYGVIILSYTIFSFLAFFFTIDPINRRRKTRFLSGGLCLAPAFIFIMIKNIVYWKLHLWRSHYFFISLFFWINSTFVLYTGFAIGILIILVRKISLILPLIDLHRSYLNQRND